MKALVMGGGMAGLCAAADLVDHDIDVQLVEATELLGGRASSWMDEDGDNIDNALHVFLPHYTNCLGFLDKVGAEPLHWTKGITNYDSQGRCGMLPVGGDLGIVRKALSSPVMSKFDQLSLGIAMAAAILMSEERMDMSDETSMLEWFKRHGVTNNAVANFRPGGVGLTFMELNWVSARALIYWIRAFLNKEFMSNPGIGFANGGLGEIYAEPARRYIQGRGGKVEAGRRVKSIMVEENRVTGVGMDDGDEIEADAFISAVPYYELRRALPLSSLDYDYFLDLWHIEEAPSVSVQIWFDRFVTEMRNIAAQIEGTFNCFADLNTIVPRFAEGAGGSMVEFVLTPAFHLKAIPEERIFRMTLEEFKRIIPAAREANVEKWAVIKGRQGIFAQRPGINKYRPVQRSPYINLYLCGDYTRTFISAGMENACASAHLAAGCVLEDMLGVKEVLFSKPTYFTPYMRSGMATGMGLAVAFIALRGMLKRMRGGRGRSGD